MDPALLADIQRQRREAVRHHFVDSNEEHHLIIAAADRHRRNTILLALLSDVVVGTLDNAFLSALGLTTSARQIVLNRQSQQHILKARKVASSADAALAAHRISEALENIQFELIPRARPDTVNVVGYVHSQSRYLRVVLKFKPGSSSHASNDECWVRTAIPFGRKQMRRARAQNRLKPV